MYTKCTQNVYHISTSFCIHFVYKIKRTIPAEFCTQNQGDHRNQKTSFQPFWAERVFFQLFLAKKYIFFQPLVIKNIIYLSLIYKLIPN